MKLRALLAGVMLVVGLVGCNSKASPTEPHVDTPWSIRVRVLDVTSQAPLQAAVVSFIGTSGDGVTLPTDSEGKTQAVTIYQPYAPQQITVHVNSRGIAGPTTSPTGYQDFTGSIGFTESYDPREAKNVWVGSVYLTRSR